MAVASLCCVADLSTTLQGSPQKLKQKVEHIIEVLQIYKDVSGNKNMQIPSEQPEVKKHLILQLYVPATREIADN